MRFTTKYALPLITAGGYPGRDSQAPASANQQGMFIFSVFVEAQSISPSVNVLLLVAFIFSGGDLNYFRALSPSRQVATHLLSGLICTIFGSIQG